MNFLTQSVSHFTCACGEKANPKLNKWYNKKTAKTKKGKIRMATCRKLLTQIYSMLKKEEYHYYRDEVNHAKKMHEYNYFLKKHSITTGAQAAACTRFAGENKNKVERGGKKIDTIIDASLGTGCS